MTTTDITEIVLMTEEKIEGKCGISYEFVPECEKQPHTTLIHEVDHGKT